MVLLFPIIVIAALVGLVSGYKVGEACPTEGQYVCATSGNIILTCDGTHTWRVSADCGNWRCLAKPELFPHPWCETGNGDTGPANTVPVNTVPANTGHPTTGTANHPTTAPANTAPPNTAPSKTVPANTVPASTSSKSTSAVSTSTSTHSTTTSSTSTHSTTTSSTSTTETTHTDAYEACQTQNARRYYYLTNPNCRRSVPTETIDSINTSKTSTISLTSTSSPGPASTDTTSLSAAKTRIKAIGMSTLIKKAMRNSTRTTTTISRDYEFPTSVPQRANITRQAQTWGTDVGSSLGSIRPSSWSSASMRSATPSTGAASTAAPQSELMKHAAQFLANEAIRNVPTDFKILFLKSKGLSTEQINQLLAASSISTSVQLEKPSPSITLPPSAFPIVGRSVQTHTKVWIEEALSSLKKSGEYDRITRDSAFATHA